ncbi:MAG TPA: AsmA-like C-terminal region-containing protein, partial [Gemmatimonadaceae bacterium]|nr:AsmA-like C-terminal region-containing protein [Gemmatimonadaceae bacterium]
MRFPRKPALALAAVAASLLVALAVVPMLFRDRIATRLKTEIGRSVNARVSWGGVALSVLADFPNVRLGLDRVSVVDVKPFEGDTLLSVRRARLVLDVASVVRYLRTGDQIVVREIDLDRPSARLRVLQDGSANWDIARKTAPPTSGPTRAVALTLRQFRIHDGSVTLDDRKSDLAASVAGLQESLRGDFAREKLVLSTRTHADSVSLRFAGVPYLSRVALEVNADVAADLRARRFTFTNDSLRLNNLVLAFSGSATAGDPNLALDLSFSAPSTAFRDILSLVPAIYARDFARLQTSGRMSAAGRVRGAYGPNAFPSFALRAQVENGAFKYSDLPLPARDIAVDLAIDNPGGDVDSTVVNLKRFHAVVGRQPLDAGFVMRTPVSDPDVDLRLNGTVNLADVARTVKLAGVNDLSGVVAADVAMRARMSQLNAGRYDQVAARGTVGVARFALKSATLPHPMTIDTASLRLTPRRAELTTFAGRIGNSDVKATGALDNVLGFALRDEVLRGEATVSSEHFDLNEWRSSDTTMEIIPVPANVDFALQASAARVTYGTLTAANVHGGLRVKDRRVTLDDLRMDMLRGSVVANGFYETTVPTRPTFDLGLRVTSLDIPTAFAALTTVQKLAPVARWAQGTVSGDFALKGPLGHDMLPLYDALSGRGTVESGQLVMQGVPVLSKLAESLALEQLRNPAVEALRASFEITNGRLRVKPFDVRMGGTTMTVSGSNGIDQSLSYDLALAVPRAEVGAAAGRVVSRLASQAGKAGLDLSTADAVELGARVTGTVMNPTVTPNFSGVANSTRDALHYAAKQAVETHVADARQRVDSAAEDARRRARAEADRVIAEAERHAATVREEARTLAE